jgi:hypothetical protein
MKKLHLLLVISFITCQFIFAQQIEILSKKTQKPISFAIVHYMVDDSIVRGGYTNNEGKITLSLSNDVNFLEISHSDYNSYKFSTQNIQQKIYLETNENSINCFSEKKNINTEDLLHTSEKNLINLQEVVVRSKRKSTKYLGYKAKRNIFGNTKGFIPVSGKECITLIENPYQKNKDIKSLVLFLYSENHPSEAIFRVNLYTNENNKPQKLLCLKNNKNVFALNNDLKVKKGRVKIDIENWGVVLPKEGLFVGVEYIGFLDKKTNNIIDYKVYEANGTDFDNQPHFVLGLKPLKKILYSYYRYNFPVFKSQIIPKNWYNFTTEMFTYGTDTITNYTPAFGIEVEE